MVHTRRFGNRLSGVSADDEFVPIDTATELADADVATLAALSDNAAASLQDDDRDAAVCVKQEPSADDVINEVREAECSRSGRRRAVCWAIER